MPRHPNRRACSKPTVHQILKEWQFVDLGSPYTPEALRGLDRITNSALAGEVSGSKKLRQQP